MNMWVSSRLRAMAAERIIQGYVGFNSYIWPPRSAPVAAGGNRRKPPPQKVPKPIWIPLSPNMEKSLPLLLRGILLAMRVEKAGIIMLFERERRERMEKTPKGPPENG